MTLFGGRHPEHDVLTVPDCMTAYVHEDLLHGYDEVDAFTASETVESVFAWFMLNVNFAVVREVAIDV
jgi:hypothetical protein